MQIHDLFLLSISIAMKFCVLIRNFDKFIIINDKIFIIIIQFCIELYHHLKIKKNLSI